MTEPPQDLLGGVTMEGGNFNDFEKVERPDEFENQHQDKKITSTSFAEETPEEETKPGTESSNLLADIDDLMPKSDSNQAQDIFDPPASDQLLDLNDFSSPPQISADRNTEINPFGVDFGPVSSTSEPEPFVEPKYSPPEPSVKPEPPVKSEPPVKTEPVDSTEPKVKEEVSDITPTSASWMKNVDPRVMDLIYWRDVRKTGVVFGSMLFMLLSLAFFSVLSVVAYLSLAALTVTFSFRVYKNVLTAVQKTGDGHPFKQYLEMNIELSEEKINKAVRNVLSHVNCTVREVRRMFLIEDYVDSLKFGIFLWFLTYLGSWFNGMTLIIMGVILVFSVPKVYEMYKVQIDEYASLACTQVKNVVDQVKEKVPMLKKKAKVQ